MFDEIENCNEFSKELRDVILIEIDEIHSKLAIEDDADLDCKVKEELEGIENDNTPSLLRKQVNPAVKRLKTFLKKMKLCEGILRLPLKILNNCLRFSYSLEKEGWKILLLKKFSHSDSYIDRILNAMVAKFVNSDQDKKIHLKNDHMKRYS